MGAKKNLVVDIDETLLTIEPVFYLERFYKNYSKKQGVKTLFFGKEHYVMPRPFAEEFLSRVSKNLNIIAWSIADKEITREKLKVLRLDHFFTCILGRQELINGKKSLQWLAHHLNTNVESITALDDIPKCYDMEERVIPIKPWLVGSGDNDTELLKSIALIESKFYVVVSSELKKMKNIVVGGKLP